MKKTFAITAFIGGVLLILVPRFILPACEYQGFSPMHCSDTAKAEYVIGGVLMIIGALAWFLNNVKVVIAGSVVAFIAFLAAYVLPDQFGYCQNPRMPCNYGMVPGIRFIAVAGALVSLVTVIVLLKNHFTKGKS